MNKKNNIQRVWYTVCIALLVLSMPTVYAGGSNSKKTADPAQETLDKMDEVFLLIMAKIELDLEECVNKSRNPVDCPLTSLVCIFLL